MNEEQEIQKRARKLMLIYVNKNRMAIGIKPLTSISKGYWNAYKAEFIEQAKKEKGTK